MPTLPRRPLLPPHPRLRAGHLQAGRLRAEDGSMTVFALFVFVGMILIAGIAVDMMRTEHERVRMQGASDRAVLAATMLRENVLGATPEQIAQAYIEAEGLGAQLGGRIAVEEFEGGRRVTIAPGATVPTMFMRMVGVEDLPLATRAQAVESLGSIRMEIALVLDTTGSMETMTANGRTRIQNLRVAAADLVETLLEDRRLGEVALTIVPYSEHVLPPPGFINHFRNLPQAGGACPDWQSWNSIQNSLHASIIRRNCDTSPWRTVRPYVHDVATAVGIINNLQARGSTSIDLGLRFGAMFFDPTINPAVRNMVANGSVDRAFEHFPLPADAPNVIRAMILMTDGENCCGARFPVATQDANALAVCSALRDAGVTLYTVAFEAPARGVALMQACASSPNHFFNTDGARIADTFAAVATHIQTRALRLTQ